MSKTFTYSFADGSYLTITTSDNAQQVNAGDPGGTTYSGFPITTTSGTFGGQPVTGLYGASGVYQQGNGGDVHDNTIFVSSTQGEGGSSYDGIDTNGIDFSLQNGNHINLYQNFNNQGAGATTLSYSTFNAQGAAVGNQNSSAPVTQTNYSTAVVCYCTGTLIRIVRHCAEVDVAVEDLVIGDLVVTRDGRQVPVRWIGHRDVRCVAHPTPRKAWPVRVRADAFGPGLPYADLWLSPEHALCLADTLVPVGALIDGDRVAQIEQDEITYWHVEVESGHDVILANGMPAESYLDTGNRRFFGDDGVVGLHFNEDPAPGWDGTGTCLPLVDSGPRLSAIRTLYGLGQNTPAQPTATAGVHLVAADGTMIAPCVASETELRFVVPAGSGDLRLASPCFRAAGDVRRLGVLVSGMAVSDGSGWREIALDHPGLYAGFHDAERDGDRAWRWTDGDGHLAATLFDADAGAMLLKLKGVFSGLHADESDSLHQKAA